MTTPTANIPSSALELENQQLRNRVTKLEEIVLAYRNERAQIIRWLGLLRGHINGESSFFEQPNYIAEVIHGSRNNDQGRTETGS